MPHGRGLALGGSHHLVPRHEMDRLVVVMANAALVVRLGVAPHCPRVPTLCLRPLGEQAFALRRPQPGGVLVASGDGRTHTAERAAQAALARDYPGESDPYRGA